LKEETGRRKMDEDSNMEIQYDIWLDNDGKAFGEECFRLLEAVEETGSLNKAAADLSLSYSGALSILKRSEERLGFTLLERRTGGSSGGGSRLTPGARKLVARYRSFTDEILGTIDTIYRKHFGWNNNPIQLMK
jgi:molybdate transport system regulatory protein